MRLRWCRCLRLPVLLHANNQYSPRQLEEACEKALKHLSLPRYKNIKLIIQYNQDTRQVNQEDENNDDFAFVRGSSYYGGNTNE